MSEPSVEVFMPWGGSAADMRARTHGASIVVGYLHEHFPAGWRYAITDTEPFRRGHACNLAAAHSNADVIVFNDADSIVHPEQLARAIAWAWEHRGFCRAYTHYYRLTDQATRLTRHWSKAVGAPTYWQQEGTPSHGVCAFHRDTFVFYGGYDPRFVYFYDDLSLDIRAGDVPQHRIPGALWHLWHPDRPVPDSDEALWRRYEHEDPNEVRAEVGWPC